MGKRVSAAEAKAHLSELMAQVAYGGQRVIIERRGKPMAALVSIDELRRLEREAPADVGALGALALLGAWADAVSDEEIDALVEHIYAERERDTGRPVRLEP